MSLQSPQIQSRYVDSYRNDWWNKYVFSMCRYQSRTRMTEYQEAGCSTGCMHANTGPQLQMNKMLTLYLNAWSFCYDLSSPSQRPSFEHAGLTCYPLLSPTITFSLFHSELKTENQKILSSTLVCFCLTDLMALDCLMDLFAHRFYVLVLFFFCFN